MTARVKARVIADEALKYRADQTKVLQRIYARFDIKAAMEHAPNCANCSHRLGNDPSALQDALMLIP